VNLLAEELYYPMLACILGEVNVLCTLQDPTRIGVQQMAVVVVDIQLERVQEPELDMKLVLEVGALSIQT
jgi:hypothetical protein